MNKYTLLAAVRANIAHSSPSLQRQRYITTSQWFALHCLLQSWWYVAPCSTFPISLCHCVHFTWKLTNAISTCIHIYKYVCTLNRNCTSERSSCWRDSLDFHVDANRDLLHDAAWLWALQVSAQRRHSAEPVLSAVKFFI